MARAVRRRRIEGCCKTARQRLSKGLSKDSAETVFVVAHVKTKNEDRAQGLGCRNKEYRMQQYGAGTVLGLGG